MVEVQGKCSSSNVPAGVDNASSEEWPKTQTHYTSKEPQPLICPACGSTRIYKNGHRSKGEIEIQRYVCQKCGHRFSEKTPNHYKACSTKDNRQICAILQVAKNLTEATKTKIVAGRENHSNTPQDVKGKIVELCFCMQKQGFSITTIRLNRTALNVLVTRGADLSNSESVKETIKVSLERISKKKRHKRLHAIPENSRSTLGATTLQSKPQIPLHPNRKRNRRPNSRMRKKRRNISATAQRNCHAMRGSQTLRLDRHRLRKKHHYPQRPRERQHPRLWKVSQNS
jgi:transposase-like protein